MILHRSLSVFNTFIYHHIYLVIHSLHLRYSSHLCETSTQDASTTAQTIIEKIAVMRYLHSCWTTHYIFVHYLYLYSRMEQIWFFRNAATSCTLLIGSIYYSFYILNDIQIPCFLHIPGIFQFYWWVSLHGTSLYWSSEIVMRYAEQPFSFRTLFK